MKKLFSVLLVSVLAVLTCQAEDFTHWNGINKATVEQHIDADTCTIYVYGHSTAERKNDNHIEKQMAAFAELGQTVVKALKKEFKHAKVQQIDDLSKAPAGALVVDALLKEINWGSGAMRQLIGFSAGNISAIYEVRITNANGLVCWFQNQRQHDTTFSSAKGAPVIKTYNGVIAKETVIVLKAIKNP